MSAFASTSQQSDLVAAVRAFAVGGLSAVVSKTTVAPMDRVKLVLQLRCSPALGGHYSGTVDCLRRLCAEQGVLSLWRGNCAALSRCFPSHALNFVLRDYYRLLFLRNVDRKVQYGRFVVGNIAAGGVGAATSLSLLYPLDLTRTKLAVDANRDGSRRYRGLWHCLREVGRCDGVTGLYRGFCVSLQFVVLSRAVFFGLFDTIRGTIVENPHTLNFFTTWLIAQSCVVSSSLLCYPLDTVRRTLMVQSGRVTKDYAGTLDCWRRLIRRDGVAGLYRGAFSNSLKSSSGALMVALYYEAAKYV